MVDLGHEIMHLGNVYFVFAQLPHLYYPAGLLVALRQPIPETHVSAWEAFKETLEPTGAPEPRLGIDGEMRGTIIHEPEDGEVWTESVLVVDLMVPLVGMTAAIARLLAAGIVPNGTAHRLVVSPFLSIVAARGPNPKRAALHRPSR